MFSNFFKLFSKLIIYKRALFIFLYIDIYILAYKIDCMTEKNLRKFKQQFLCAIYMIVEVYLVRLFGILVTCCSHRRQYVSYKSKFSSPIYKTEVGGGFFNSVLIFIQDNVQAPNHFVSLFKVLLKTHLQHTSHNLIPFKVNVCFKSKLHWKRCNMRGKPLTLQISVIRCAFFVSNKRALYKNNISNKVFLR